MKNVTGQVDLTRMKLASRGSPELWRVGSGQDYFQTPRVGSGRVRRFSKSRGSGRVGSRRLEILAGRGGSGRVKTSRNCSRVGSGQLTRADPTRPARFDPTREKPLKYILYDSYIYSYILRKCTWLCVVVLCPYTAQCAQQCLAAFSIPPPTMNCPPCQLENLLELSTRNSTAKRC